MSGLLLRRLSYWAAACVAVSCATYESPTPSGGGGSSPSEAGAPDGASGSKPTNGGSGAGTATTGGTKAGSESGGSDVGGSSSGGKASTDAGAPTMAEAGMPPLTNGGAAGDAGAGAGGTPDPGCGAPTDCDDQNPCTDDDCVDTVCQHTNNVLPCTDDADDCTDDLCKDGACGHVNNSAPCEDDNDACTKDVCAGDYCTHPDNGTCQCQKAADCNDSNPCTTDACVGNQCKYTNNVLPCATDQNPCTDDVCAAGVCSHPNNTDSCSDDGDACTGDVCAAGICTHPTINGCCSGDGDCFDNNVCTNDSCVNSKCAHANNTLGCAADGSPCTLDSCSAGSCKHPTNNVCAGSDDVIIFVNRNSQYVVLNGQNLEYTGATAGAAAVFEKVGEVGTKFKLRSVSSGLYVTLGLNDALVASADQAGGMLFDAPTCGAAPWVGLNATTDVNGGSWVAADVGNALLARSGDCGAASATSWEKFQLTSVTIPCSKLADCDDGNACTDDTCGVGGFCVYTDHVGTCTDDANTCTDDVCNTGTCTHLGNGTCTGPLVAIQVNRDAKNYVALNASYLEYTALSTATAEKFELVDKVGTQFRLRASNLKFVTLDVNDNLIANADFAGSMLFDSPACGTNVALIATSDDDANKYVQSAGGNRLIAGNGNCNAASATAWEKFSLIPQ